MPHSSLIFLSYATNDCYTTLSETPPPGFRIVDDQKWEYQGKTYRTGTDVIRYEWGSGARRNGLIGVYDRNSIIQLGNMISAARDATRDPCAGGPSD